MCMHVCMCVSVFACRLCCFCCCCCCRLRLQRYALLSIFNLGRWARYPFSPFPLPCCVLQQTAEAAAEADTAAALN